MFDQPAFEIEIINDIVLHCLLLFCISQCLFHRPRAPPTTRRAESTERPAAKFAAPIHVINESGAEA